MDEFVSYIKNLKNRLDKEAIDKIHIVIGNESCDLDSAVSALSFAYFLYKIKYNSSSDVLVLPVMNVTNEEFVLRTENCYCLKNIGIDLKWLLYCNDIDWCHIINEELNVTLVDHHVLSEKNENLRNYVTEIYDHRPLDLAANWNMEHVLCKIEQVGSCSTLIAASILKFKEILTESLASILYKTINFDTIGFKLDAGKVMDLDLHVANELEQFLNIDQKDRCAIFDELWRVHNDVSHLTAKQLLCKDLKIVNTVFIPGLPMLVEQYLKIPDALTSLKDYVIENNVSVIVLMGLEAKNILKRDLALYTLTNCKLMGEIMDALLKMNSLHLMEKNLNTSGIRYFAQQNNKLSRKQILPVIKQVVIQDC